MKSLLKFLTDNGLTLVCDQQTRTMLSKGVTDYKVSLELKGTDTKEYHECIYVADSANGKHQLPYVAKIEDAGSVKQALADFIREVGGQNVAIMLNNSERTVLRRVKFPKTFDYASVIENLG